MNFVPNSHLGKAYSLAIVLIFVLASAFVRPLTWHLDDFTCSRYIPVANHVTPASKETHSEEAHDVNHLSGEPVRAFCNHAALESPQKTPTASSWASPASSRFSLGMLRALQMPIQLNELDREDWESLSGIGPKLAKRIIDFRSARGGFRSLDDLSQVPGIGPARMMILQAALNEVDRCPKGHFACNDRSVIHTAEP